MHKLIALTLMLLISIVVQAAEVPPQPDWCDYSWNPDKESVPPRLNLPEWACYAIKKANLTQKFSPEVAINPFFITGDFDGDNQTDIAIRIKNNQTRDVGLAIVHYQTKQVFIVGAGDESGRGKNLRWFDMWTIEPKGKVEKSSYESQAATLKGDALLLMKSESATAVLFWNGKKYVWYQTSD